MRQYLKKRSVQSIQVDRIIYIAIIMIAVIGGTIYLVKECGTINDELPNIQRYL